MSGEPALMPMLTPQHRRAPCSAFDIHGQIDRHGRFGVAEGRALLQSLGVDGSVPFEVLPVPAVRGPTVIAKGAQFLGGISGRSQRASRGTTGKSEETGPLSPALELLASRADLTAIGAALGEKEVARPDRVGAASRNGRSKATCGRE